MATLLFGDVVSDDGILAEKRRQALRRNELPRWNHAPFDIIVLDEFQDCTELIFWLVNCFIKANEREMGGQPARLVVLGDERQSIYQFQGSDQRYLTLAPETLAHITPYPFAKLSLSESFRLSQETVQFVNHTYLDGRPYITSSKTGLKPMVLRYEIKNSYGLAKKLLALINKYKAKNSVMIAPSIRKNKPLKEVTNMLSATWGVPIAVPRDDESNLQDVVIDGKMCLSTIHQFKGNERDLVIVWGMDSSYFKFYGRDIPDDKCPNTVFVALTRAVKRLVLIHHEEQKPMPFVSVQALYRTAAVVNMTENEAKIEDPDAPGRPPETGLTLPERVGVRDMTRHIRNEWLDEIVKRELRIKQLSRPLPKEEHIEVPNIVLTDPVEGFHEAVADINGLVVVAAFEYATVESLSTLDLGKLGALSKLSPQERVSWLCRRACEYEAQYSGYRPRSIQMKNHSFDWMKPEDLAKARERLQKELRGLPGRLKFEVGANCRLVVGNQKTYIEGRSDIVQYVKPLSRINETIVSIWEVKFVSQLSTEHIIQACTYAYLLPSGGKNPSRIILYNVKDGEKLEITPCDGREGLRRMIESILRLKYTVVEEKGNEEFIEMCGELAQEVVNLGSSDAGGN